MIQHTRGPWVIEGYSIYTKPNGFQPSVKLFWANWHQFKNQVPVAVSASEALANVQLVAAAPDMLEALEYFLACGPQAGQNKELLFLVETVVKKARGEK